MDLVHICEVCGKNEILNSEQAFKNGWDYPPRMGAFGVISPRTCGNCTVNDTLWWALMVDKIPSENLDDNKKATLDRILNEPESILVK